VPQTGVRQPAGGFSALIDAPGHDRYWAMPDNGSRRHSRTRPRPRLRRSPAQGSHSRSSASGEWRGLPSAAPSGCSTSTPHACASAPIPTARSGSSTPRGPERAAGAP
jgi:hypothetical protein